MILIKSISRKSKLSYTNNSRHFYGYESEIQYLDFFLKKKREELNKDGHGDDDPQAKQQEVSSSLITMYV